MAAKKKIVRSVKKSSSVNSSIYTKTMKLNNGINIPIVGLGTYEIPEGKDAFDSTLYALKVGYRHIDTAQYYANEQSIGEAIRKSKIPRKEIFVTTKIKNGAHGDPRAALEGSLKRLGLDYVDLYLIHWPVPERLKTWKIHEELYKEGKCKSIGVSNFTIKHLEELSKIAKIVPAVNQVEFSPYLYQEELLKYCKSKGIAIEAYSPLTRGKKLNDPKLIKIADRYKKSTAQMMIRWAIQKGLVVLPKSTHNERIKENIEVNFEISPKDMKELDALNENRRYCWDPSNIK